jgi:hypothetical protein
MLSTGRLQPAVVYLCVLLVGLQSQQRTILVYIVTEISAVLPVCSYVGRRLHLAHLLGRHMGLC